MQLLDNNQPMTVDEDIEAMPQRSPSLPPMTPSPVHGSSALAPASADDAKNDHCYLCLDGGEDLYYCMQCPQVVCYQCILVLAESHSQVREANVDFTCPVLHW
ncbi:hypothetical protein PAXRUDRAFT_18239 [Paxillus rubicundulus Ve08.2h10]|uniref:Uncharacterized protein n=1 Tax=Paxillus rubicundulus Ve08.2h10 TaxID=930991 RepID=A0A0D0DFD9_9AGAM|nr:hypothetical protein PAXRUDRAFT_18239 [Paxillus rubicundulus Ve08.2h10]